MSLKFEVARRRHMYIKIANRELIKESANHDHSLKIVRGCDRITSRYVKYPTIALQNETKNIDVA